MATYNGHKNWNYWNVSLWINNDEWLYHLARRCIRKTKSRAEAANAMKEELAAMEIEQTPDGANYTKTAIQAAMVGM